MMDDDLKSHLGSVSNPCYTPTHTSAAAPSEIADHPFSVEQQGVGSIPWDGRTYMIRHRASDKVLARHQGRLVLQQEADLANCAWKWTCEENSGGWLGFRETTSGVYLGRDNSGGFQATATKHRGWELFDTRQHPDGGYQLLSVHWWFRMRMAADRGANRVIEIATSPKEDGNALWDFIQLEVLSR